MSIEQFDKVSASFEPLRRDDLQHGAEEWIGRTLTWQAVYIVEGGPYDGEWAMTPVLDIHDQRTPFAWVPLSDLNITTRFARDDVVRAAGEKVRVRDAELLRRLAR